MRNPVWVACGAALGIMLAKGLCVVWSTCMRRMKNRSRRAAPRGYGRWPKFETTKLVIWVSLINGFAWVWCSYVLAYLDKVQIAESLSQVAVTEIIGVVLAYCIKSAVENLSKNNRWPDKGSGPEDPPGAG